MKRHVLTIVFLITASVLTAAAQTVEQQVGKIRQLYADTNKRIETGLDDKVSGLHHAVWTIGGERDGQQWAAVGSMKSNVEFYFDGEPNLGEKPTDARKLVRKINFNYTSGAEPRTRAEYFFAERTGELVFAHVLEYTAGEDGSTVERRFYYQKNKLIRVTRDGKNIDRGIGNEDANLAANAMQDAKRFQNIFALIFSE